MSTGAEANECAIKIARKYGSKFKNGAYEIITTLNGFHGRTLATMSATGKEQFKNLFEPKVGGFIHVPYNDIDAIRSKISENTAAIMVEPIQGEGGVITSEIAYIKALRDICNEKKIILIFDEIQTGLCRTGKLFCYEHYGIEPDVITLAKGIGGGYPLSACLSKNEFCVFDPGDQGGTYTGQPLGMAVGFAVVNELIGKNICCQVEKTGEYLTGKLKELQSKGLIENIRGKGLLLAFDAVNKTGQEILELCMKDGLLINSPRPKTIRLFPALVVTEKEIDLMLSILKKYL
jgi:acetylornithine/N-succinyldiaminopimelate aminotransferase